MNDTCSINPSRSVLLVLLALGLGGNALAQSASASRVATPAGSHTATPVASATSATSTATASAEQTIIKLIATTYDQPGRKVETTPVVIASDYALADWIQGDKGGRALLRHKAGQWEIMACGGDGFKDAKTLQQAGIPAATASKLVAQLTQAEKALPASRVRQFGLFGTADDPRLKHHGQPASATTHHGQPASAAHGASSKH